MTRLFPLAALLVWAAAPARAGVWLKQWAIVDESRTPGKDYYGSSTEVSAPFGKDMYRVWARAKIFRARESMKDAQEEFSLALQRELFHVTVAGRLGTEAPGAEGAGYHLAGGEAWLTFYGATLGPRRPEMSSRVWESTAPAPAAESFDQTWVTEIHTIYNNTDHHLHLANNQTFVIVENSWQFELRETWNKRTSVAAQMGFDRYNKTVTKALPQLLLNNLDYPGGMFAIAGFPNNHVAFDAWQRLGPCKVWAGATRLNVLGDRLSAIYGGGVDWEAGERWTLSAGFSYKHRRGQTSRRGVSLSAAYRW